MNGSPAPPGVIPLGYTGLPFLPTAAFLAAGLAAHLALGYSFFIKIVYSLLYVPDELDRLGTVVIYKFF